MRESVEYYREAIAIIVQP